MLFRKCARLNWGVWECSLEWGNYKETHGSQESDYFWGEYWGVVIVGGSGKDFLAKCCGWSGWWLQGWPSCNNSLYVYFVGFSVFGRFDVEKNFLIYQFSSVQSLSRVRLFVTPWIAARQASLSITNSQSSLRLMSIESVMPSSHLILCHPLSILPPIPPSIRVFSNESALRTRWPKYSLPN